MKSSIIVYDEPFVPSEAHAKVCLSFIGPFGILYNFRLFDSEVYERAALAGCRQVPSAVLATEITELVVER